MTDHRGGLQDLSTSTGDIGDVAENRSDVQIANGILWALVNGARDVRQESTGRAGDERLTLAQVVRGITGWPRTRIAAALEELKRSGRAIDVAPERMVTRGRD